MTRYDVSVTDGTYVERHVAVSTTERNRLADFAFRHDLRCVVLDAAAKARGEGTYR